MMELDVKRVDVVQVVPQECVQYRTMKSSATEQGCNLGSFADHTTGARGADCGHPSSRWHRGE